MLVMGYGKEMNPSAHRPAPFPPGTHLSEHYTVEGLVRLAEGRMFYLANDDRPDRPRRFCWECGNDDTPRATSHCVSCGVEMSPQRFLLSVRWDQELFEPFRLFFEKGLQHPSIAAPVDMFFHDGVLCTVTRWAGEGILLDEGSPMELSRVLHMTQRVTGTLAFLQNSGISLSRVTPANFLIREDDTLLLFDPDILQVHDDVVPFTGRGPEVQELAGLMRRYTPIRSPEIADFFAASETGVYSSPLAFGRALEALLQAPDADTQVTNGAMTDVGLCRVLNEDNWGWVNLAGEIDLFVVADGMGGHDAGEVASQMAVAGICAEARGRLANGQRPTPERLENVLEEAFRHSNNSIKSHSETMGNDMGTTMVAALVMKNKLAYVANVGDSRGYLLREQVLHQITRDHSLVARMVEQNRITPEEARNHPHSNILLRTVGTEHDVDVDIFSVELEKGDQIMLCSDGLWGEVEDEDIELILNEYDDPRVSCRELIRAAHHGGGRDNITVLVVSV